MHYCSHGEQCPLLSQFFRTMRARVRVWDNGGSTADRYTVAIKRTSNGVTLWDIYTMSDDARSPQGINQYSHTDTNGQYNWTGKREKVWDLPREVINAIIDRV